jgi:hypothetical protein
LLLFGLLVLLFGQEPKPDARLALKAQGLDLVGRMQLDLALASEAEKSAVLAITVQEAQAFADQARARTAALERSRRELESLLSEAGSQAAKVLLIEFSRHFTEFQRIDAELLGLAVKNSNLEAYALTFGPAASVLDEFGAALSRVVAANAQARDAKQVMSLATGAQIGALRIQVLLPPHVAEPSGARMDELEARMAEADEQVRGDLERLGALPGLADKPDLELAASRYARFCELEDQILALSRANTDVLSLSLSLSQKRKLMLVCHETLDNLAEAVRKEPTEGATYGGRPAPRE